MGLKLVDSQLAASSASIRISTLACVGPIIDGVASTTNCSLVEFEVKEMNTGTL
jgi:hypothetical protein